MNLALPDDLCAELRLSPQQVAREALIHAVILWWWRGLLSQGRAAELLGLDRAGFMDACASRQVPVANYDATDLEQELRDVERLAHD